MCISAFAWVHACANARRRAGRQRRRLEMLLLIHARSGSLGPLSEVFNVDTCERRFYIYIFPIIISKTIKHKWNLLQIVCIIGPPNSVACIQLILVLKCLIRISVNRWPWMRFCKIANGNMGKWYKERKRKKKKNKDFGLVWRSFYKDVDAMSRWLCYNSTSFVFFLLICAFPPTFVSVCLSQVRTCE